MVYVDNPKYACKKSADSPGIDTCLYWINNFSQEGMPKSIYFYHEASSSPPRPSGCQTLRMHSSMHGVSNRPLLQEQSQNLW